LVDPGGQLFDMLTAYKNKERAWQDKEREYKIAADGARSGSSDSQDLRSTNARLQSELQSVKAQLATAERSLSQNNEALRAELATLNLQIEAEKQNSQQLTDVRVDSIYRIVRFSSFSKTTI